MRVVVDLEANSLTNPTKIWCIVCKDIDTNTIHIFRNLHENEEDLKAFISFSSNVTNWIGHNLLDYDIPVIARVLLVSLLDRSNVSFTDTLILSKLISFSRPGHSIRQYGLELGLEKIEFNDWTKWSQEMEDYCVRDVHITHKVYTNFLPYITDPSWSAAIKLEHDFQQVVNHLHTNGFAFDTNRANNLLTRVTDELRILDADILSAFPPRLHLVREIEPTITKHGTLHKKDFRWVKDGDLSDYNGYPFCKCSWIEFNPASHKQIIDVLLSAKWKPEEKTKTHIQAERDKDQEKLKHLSKYGWKINENNLSTLPSTAPSPARLLAKRILLESRRRTLTEWLGLVCDDGRIHGKFIGIGAWTHRMAHQEPNTANIPNEFNINGTKKLLGKELRSLWSVPNKKRLLVGVDAEGIQLRIFAHYIDDREFTQALINGRKDNKTDPHSLNQRILGPVCKSRAAAKRFIYALLLGAGIGKLTEILECRKDQTEEALHRLLQRYSGFAHLKRYVIPADAKKGYFVGLDGRKVPIPGDTVGERRHLCMSGYLQNGEAIVMKKACLKWEGELHAYDAKLVNFVHDEWQVECPNDLNICLAVAERLSTSLSDVGVELGLKCPLAGSYWNDDHKDYTIGLNWSVTH